MVPEEQLLPKKGICISGVSSFKATLDMFKYGSIQRPELLSVVSHNHCIFTASVSDTPGAPGLPSKPGCPGSPKLIETCVKNHKITYIMVTRCSVYFGFKVV